MGRKAPEVTLLGSAVKLPETPEQAVLERVANPHRDTHYAARFAAPEFTSLCPVTGQPDFAHLVIDYVPKDWLVESKSLKLYLGSFRNHGAFHEDCTVAIGKRLAGLLEPHYLRIGGYWYPRGGIPIDVFWQTGALPADVWLPVRPGTDLAVLNAMLRQIIEEGLFDEAYVAARTTGWEAVRATVAPYVTAWPTLEEQMRPELEDLWYQPLIDLDAVLPRLDAESQRTLAPVTEPSD